MWKKLISAAAVLAMLAGLGVPAFAQPLPPALHYQGEDNWYAVYSTQTNITGSFDTTTLRHCEIQQTSGDVRIWKPAISESGRGAYWFAVRSDGLVAPDDGYTAGLKYVVPESGAYSVDIRYSGGSGGGSGDGVIFGIYLDGRQLHAENAVAPVTGGSYTAVLQLAKGQCLYLLADPKTNGAYDSPWYNAEIVKTGNAVSSFGQNTNPMEQAGEMGWTAVYSHTANRGGSFDIAALQDCSYKDMSSGSPVWKPASGTAFQYFAVRPDGLVAPTDGYTAGVRWTAAESGVYRLNVAYSGGSSGGSGQGDGVIFGIYQDSQVLRVQDVTGSLSETAYNGTFTMLKGQSFYLLADPKGSGAYDSPWFFATVEKTGELPAYAYGQNGVSMDTQGEKGWTAVYSTAVNQTAGFPTATFQPAEYKTAESQNVWKPQAAANATPADPVYYFGIRPDGFVGPATGYTAGMKWTAPETGYYDVSVQYSGGQGSGGQGDGVIFGIYLDHQKLHEKDAGVRITGGSYTGRVAMAKGQSIYLVADPKTGGDYDDPWFAASITLAENPGDGRESLRLYDVPAAYPQEGIVFQVKVNGKPIGLYSDYNAWNNKVNFGYFDFGGEGIAEVEITPQFSYTAYELLPTADGVQSVREGNTIRFAVTRQNSSITLVLDGSYQGRTLHLFANAIDYSAPTANETGTIYFGPGFHDLYAAACAGHYEIPSNTRVYIAGGAVVKGTLAAAGVDNVQIEGRGMVMMTGNNTVNTYLNMPVAVTYSTNIAISGILVNSHRNPGWSMSAHMTQGLTVRDVKVVSTRYASTDGFDLSNSSNVLLDNLFIRSCDDCISVKGLGSGAPADSPANENIRLENLVLWNDCNNAVVLGEESVASAYRNIIVRNVDILYSYDDRDNHENLNERAALSLVCLHGTYYSDILFEDIRINRCERLMVMTFLDSFWFGSIQGDQSTPGGINGVTFRNVQVKGNSGSRIANQILLNGWNSDKTIRNVTFDNVFIQGQKLQAGSSYIVRNAYVDASQLNFS